MSNVVTPPVESTAIGRVGARVLANRALMRAPIWLYRARLGFLFGSRTLMLEHIGRKSGARRYVVLEVIGHPTPDVYIVASGFGVRAQWFRNLIANPHVRVSIAGDEPREATARRLSPAEADAALSDYVRGTPAHGRSSRTSWRTHSAVRSANVTPSCPWSNCVSTGQTRQSSDLQPAGIAGWLSPNSEAQETGPNQQIDPDA